MYVCVGNTQLQFVQCALFSLSCMHTTYISRIEQRALFAQPIVLNEVCVCLDRAEMMLEIYHPHGRLLQYDTNLISLMCINLLLI